MKKPKKMELPPEVEDVNPAGYYISMAVLVAIFVALLIMFE